MNAKIQAAKDFAEKFGFDQVIIVARKVGLDGVEDVTTYGTNKDHCKVASKIGDFLKYRIMGWAKEEEIEK